MTGAIPDELETNQTRPVSVTLAGGRSFTPPALIPDEPNADPRPVRTFCTS